MFVRNIEIWKDRFCNECQSQNDVKEVKIGNFVLALCKNCRKRLIHVLESDS